MNLSPHSVKRAGCIVYIIGDGGGIVAVSFSGNILWKFVDDVGNIIQYERRK